MPAVHFLPPLLPPPTFLVLPTGPIITTQCHCPKCLPTCNMPTCYLPTPPKDCSNFHYLPIPTYHSTTTPFPTYHYHHHLYLDTFTFYLPFFLFPIILCDIVSPSHTEEPHPTPWYTFTGDRRCGLVAWCLAARTVRCPLYCAPCLPSCLPACRMQSVSLLMSHFSLSIFAHIIFVPSLTLLSSCGTPHCVSLTLLFFSASSCLFASLSPLFLIFLWDLPAHRTPAPAHCLACLICMLE